MDTPILQTLRYFSRFKYPPTIADIHRYLSVPASEEDILGKIRVLEQTGALRMQDDRVFMSGCDYEGYFVRKQESEVLIQNARSYLSYLEMIPTIRLIGISGSMSMANGNSYDDIDLFIITSANTIWVTRFMVLLYKKVLTWVYPFIGKKLCYNLFFSENSLKLSENKHNVYVGHELLQLKVIYNKSGIYHTLLAENNWVYDLFPNAKFSFQTETYQKKEQKKHSSIIFLNILLGKVQKWWLRRIGYIYEEKEGQLWLIQRDWSVTS